MERKQVGEERYKDAYNRKKQEQINEAQKLNTEDKGKRRHKKEVNTIKIKDDTLKINDKT